MTGTERRAYERYGLQLAVKVRWTDSSGETQEETGTTKNISTSGIYMICDSCLDEGCEIEIEMDIPISMTGGSMHCVCARGKVLRNAPLADPEKGFGHAIVLHDHKFTKDR